MTTFLHTTCPYCGYQQDSHAAVGEADATPSAGSVGVCLACGEPALFAVVLGRLVLRKPTPGEREGILADETVIHVILAHRRAMETSPDWPHGPAV